MIVIKFRTRVYPLKENNLLTFFVSKSPCCEGLDSMIGWSGEGDQKRFSGFITVNATDTRYGDIIFNFMGKRPPVRFCPFCGKSVEALETKRIRMVEEKRVSHYTEYVEGEEIIIDAQVLPREADPR